MEVVILSGYCCGGQAQGGGGAVGVGLTERVWDCTGMWRCSQGDFLTGWVGHVTGREESART